MSQTLQQTPKPIDLKQYIALCKPRVVALIVFTAVVGMFMAVPGMVPFSGLLFGTLGIGLAAASAAVLNHLIDRRVDAFMQRTRYRPLPSGQVTTRQAMVLAAVLGAMAMAVLISQVNILTAVLTFASLIGYALVYTVYLKRATPQNIVIGGAAGAAPPVLGWCAITGALHPHALLLFLIIYVWTPPHFWALAVYRRDDYARVNIPMLPVTHGVPYTKLHILLYTILLQVVTLLPYLVGMSGWLYLGGAVILGGVFLYYAIRLYRHSNELIAMQTFRYSVFYLMALFSFLLVDHYVM